MANSTFFHGRALDRSLVCPNLNFIPCTVPSLVDNQRISSQDTYGIRVLAESKRVWHNTFPWVFGET